MEEQLEVIDSLKEELEKNTKKCTDAVDVRINFTQRNTRISSVLKFDIHLYIVVDVCMTLPKIRRSSMLKQT